MPSFVVSLRSRGLASFSKAKFLDWKRSLVDVARCVLDILISAGLSWYNLSWSSWVSEFILILMIALPYEVNLQRFRLFQTDIEGITVVSNVDVVTEASEGNARFCTVYNSRRNQAASTLARFKSLATSVCLHAFTLGGAKYSDQLGEAAADVSLRVFQLVDDVHMYLQHRRPMARHFYFVYMADTANTGDKGLYKESHEMGVLIRRVHRSVKVLHEAVHAMKAHGARDSQVRDLITMLSELHAYAEQISAIKCSALRSPG
eukprot:gene30775-35814_t